MADVLNALEINCGESLVVLGPGGHPLVVRCSSKRRDGPIDTESGTSLLVMAPQALEDEVRSALWAHDVDVVPPADVSEQRVTVVLTTGEDPVDLTDGPLAELLAADFAVVVRHQGRSDG